MLKHSLALFTLLALAFSLLLIPFGRAQEASSTPENPVVSLSCYSTLISGAVPGDVYRASCPANCEESYVWGTDNYSESSNLCSAAAHAGVLNLRQGGEFTIVYLGGQELYEGTERNGIESQSYNGWDLSFGFSDPISCSANANQMQGDIGSRELVTCSAGCSANAVWGTDIYRDDSALCSAAAHAGVINLEEGGTFFVSREAGQASYLGTEQNEISSADWGESSYSFSVSAASNVLLNSCETTAFYFAGEAGTEYTMTCPADCPADAIWGTEIYADDSAICTAAAHAGLISLAEGGTFTLTIEAGLDSYTGSNANGIISEDYAAWPRSFSVSGN